jgi:glycosyltransferase involved in cell wall biosynthesis
LVALVVPCYNEEMRLPAEAFAKAKNLSIKILFVNDGSTDQTLSLLNKLSAQSPEWIQVLNLPSNHGKAEAVRQGMLLARKTFNEDFEWIGFWDADLATPLEEVPYFLEFLAISSATSFKPLMIFGVRLQRLGALIKRKSSRHYLGRIFVTIASVMLNIKSYDSQCGAKLFRAEVIEPLFREAFITRWVFDLEIMLRARSMLILECPVRHWEDVAGSKVKILRESLRVFTDLWKLRQKYL